MEDEQLSRFCSVMILNKSSIVKGTFLALWSHEGIQWLNGSVSCLYFSTS